MRHRFMPVRVISKRSHASASTHSIHKGDFNPFQHRSMSVRVMNTHAHVSTTSCSITQRTCEKCEQLQVRPSMAVVRASASVQRGYESKCESLQYL